MKGGCLFGTGAIFFEKQLNVQNKTEYHIISIDKGTIMEIATVTNILYV